MNSKLNLFKGLIFHPFKTISLIQQSEASPKDPLPILSLIGVVSAVGSFLATRKMMTSLLEAMSTMPEVERFTRLITTLSGIFSFLGGFIGPFIGWIGATLAFHIFAKLLGGEGRFKKLLEIEGWCLLPRLFSAVIALTVIAFYFPAVELPAQLLSDPAQFRQIIENLTRTIQLSTPLTFSRVLGRMMTFWFLFLSGIAVNKEYGLSKAKTILCVLIPYFAYFIISSLPKGVGAPL